VRRAVGCRATTRFARALAFLGTRENGRRGEILGRKRAPRADRGTVSTRGFLRGLRFGAISRFGNRAFGARFRPRFGFGAEPRDSVDFGSLSIFERLPTDFRRFRSAPPDREMVRAGDPARRRSGVARFACRGVLLTAASLLALLCLLPLASAKRGPRIPDDLDGVVDSEEDEAYKAWGRRKGDPGR
jgi:hypothetical protein